MKNLSLMSKSDALNIINSETPREVLEFYQTPYNISNHIIEEYNENGFVKIENVVDKVNIDFIKKIIEASVVIRKDHDKRTFDEKSNYEKSFLQCGYLCFDFPIIKDFVLSKRFAGIAKDLINVQGIRLWHDQALFKESGGRFTPVHQDSSYWPLKHSEKTTTMWLSLNGSSRQNGCLYFYPGSHLLEKEYVDIFTNPHSPTQLFDIKKHYVELNPGDATFHSGLTFHGTDENRSADIREGMTVIYFNDGNKFDSSDERNRTHKSCIGLKHGIKVNTQYTPKLI